jgi:hypothetical protein
MRTERKVTTPAVRVASLWRDGALEGGEHSLMSPTVGLEPWRDLFVMLGSSAGALVGLLFIVMSLHFEKISLRSDANTRITIDGGRNNTYHLLTVLIEAALVLTPQPMPLLGAELITINLFGLRLPLTITLKYFRQNVTISERSGFPTAVILTIAAAYILGAVGGGVLASLRAWGLYLVAASCLTKVVRTVLTAWMLMFGTIQIPAGATKLLAGEGAPEGPGSH